MFGWLIAASLIAPAARGQAAYELEPINYNTAPLSDPIAKLQARIDAGKAKLQRDAQHGYLPSVLKQLGIPASSQTGPTPRKPSWFGSPKLRAFRSIGSVPCRTYERWSRRATGQHDRTGSPVCANCSNCATRA